MKSVGIVGSEGAKFTSETEEYARELIRELIAPYDRVVSGGCHLGGIDIWAIQEAFEAGKETSVHLPKILAWTGGYKERNLEIAKDSDKVFCITVKEFPEDYTGMRFPYCYHCKTDAHIKSGGCWTVKKAIEMGKEGEVLVL